MLFLSVALALTCDPADTLCETTNQLESAIDNAYGADIVDAGAAKVRLRPQQILAELTAIDAYLQQRGCTVELDGIGGAYHLGTDVMEGARAAETVFGTVDQGLLTASEATGPYEYGSGFGRLKGTTRWLTDRNDGGFAMGRWVRVNGVRGIWFGLTGRCSAGDAPEATRGWIKGDHTGWSPNDTDLDGVPDADDACPGADDMLDADTDGQPDACDACPLPAANPVYVEDFEVCPGWTLAGDWQCGAPTSGPGGAFSGGHVLATNLSGPYANNGAYNTNTATSGPIIVPANAVLEMKIWSDVEGFDYDGFNLKASSGGTPFTTLTDVTPGYDAMVGGQPAWNGDRSGEGYVTYTACLGDYADQVVQLQLAMRTDGSVTEDGVYVDDVIIWAP